MRVPERKRASYTWRWAAALGTLAVVAVGLVVWLTVGPSPDVHAANFTVDSTADNADSSVGDGDCEDASGDCTLRAAIQEANFSAGVPDTISFNISGSGPHVITLSSVLPTITDDDLTINGGAEVIQLLVNNNFNGLNVDADNVTIGDLIINGNGKTGAGISVAANNDDAIIDPVEIKNFNGPGISFSGNNDGNLVDAAHIHDNGGTGVVVGADSDENIIRDSTIEDNGTGVGGGDGIYLDDSAGNQITGNTIEDNGSQSGDNGIDAANQSDLLISRNTISDNFDNQILITGGSTGVVTITNNVIDVDSDGIELDGGCSCGDVAINGGSDSQANQFSGPLGAQEYYVENMSGQDVDATHNDWAGDSDPTDKICATNQTNANCDAAIPASGDVDWSPVAPAGAGGVATLTPTPTVTVTVTPTVTGTPPTATPTGTPPTATPTVPVGDETVSLIAGCQFEPWTGAASINPVDLAAHVSPTTNIRGLWAQQPPPAWKGYSPSFPEASDMGPVERLKVVAFCMVEPGTFTRPLI